MWNDSCYRGIWINNGCLCLEIFFMLVVGDGILFWNIFLFDGIGFMCKFVMFFLLQFCLINICYVYWFFLWLNVIKENYILEVIVLMIFF